MEFRTGYGAVWLDLLATRLSRYRDTPRELLPDAAALRAWLGDVAGEAAVPREKVTDADAAWARELREALHAITAATVRHERPRRADVAVLTRALADDVALAPRATADGVRLARPVNARQVLGRLARDAADQLGAPSREHVHACGDETCAMFFHDPTGRRRWCSDVTCGVRARVRAHRARQRPAATPSVSRGRGGAARP